MSLDTTYRPRRYDDVLGQAATIAILREYVRSGRGLHQSYLFCGGHGSGKTTLGRILARALLCAAPKDGNPCDECPSCLGMLADGTSADFVEVDAATNSGKSDILKITEEIQYATFSGRRRLYLFDEAHQLSKEALDALLKYLEDTFPGTKDKKLTCIFCTTEPEKMRATILSRCAPAFVVQPQKPEVIAQRLALVCEKEGIQADPAMLTLIAEVTECHIRDALKAVEGVSMLGEVNQANVTAYLHLDLNTTYIDLLAAIGTNLPRALELARNLMQRVSPVTCYGKLAEVAMLAYQVFLGESATGMWNPTAFKALTPKAEALLGYASRFASRPGRPTAAMLLLDISSLHHVGGSVREATQVLQVAQVAPVAQVVPAAPPPASTAPEPPPSAPTVQERSMIPVKGVPLEIDLSGGTVEERDRDWVVDPRLVNNRGKVPTLTAPKGKTPYLSTAEFGLLLGKLLTEKQIRSGRST